MELLFIFAVLLLCYSNGANDNFKGFATVWGSGAAEFGAAKLWATLATVAGALAALYLAQDLVASFSGRGLVPDALAGTAPFVLAVTLGAGLTVLLATMLGFPISTTHAIIGGLVGAGLAAGAVSSGSAVNFGKLGQTFLLPLLLSPLLSALVAFGLFFAIRRFRRAREPEAEATGVCVCLAPAPVTSDGFASAAKQTPSFPLPIIASSGECADDNATVLASVTPRGALNTLHYASAACICFARGLNDTPKLVALLLATKALGLSASFGAVAVAMALGGWLNAKKVASTMSKNLVPLGETQGLAANVVTALLVISASKFGLPVSTTHVSVGSISGVGFAAGEVRTSELGKIVLSWVITLPCAAGIAALAITSSRYFG
jgi:inorganic phosphate transporter, PiT family